MAEAISYSHVCRMLTAAAEQIRANHEMLSRLDSAVGDGDHGTTMLRTMDAVTKAVSESPGASLKDLFSSVAWSIKKLLNYIPAISGGILIFYYQFRDIKSVI